MFKTIQFPIKGTYYYHADMAIEEQWIEPNSPLIFKAEPDNEHDINAIQIWCQNPFTSQTDERLLGYVPRRLAQQLTRQGSLLLKQNYPLDTQVIHSVKKGKLIKIDCQIQLNYFSWHNIVILRWIAFWIKQQQTIQGLFNYFLR